jgi:predicted ATPase
MQSLDLTLKRLVIQNYKSIRRVEIDHLRNLVLLMGRNNAGKSNCLDACKFVADAAVSFKQALAERGGEWREVAHRKKLAEKIEFIFDFTLNPDAAPRRAAWIAQLFAGNKLVTPEAAAATGFLSALRLRVTIGADEFSEELSTPNLVRGDWFTVFSLQGSPAATTAASGQLETLCKRCGGDLPAEPVALETTANEPYRLRLGQPGPCPAQPVSTELAEAVRQQFLGLEWVDPLRQLPSSSPILGSHTLAHDASNLPDVLHWLYNNKPKQFRRIETEVARLVPQLGRLYTPTVQNAATVGMIDDADEELVYSMGQLSYGTRSLIAIVSKVILAPPGSWVCIEEPETYLHPQAQTSLFQFLRDEAASKRIFVATHSTGVAASCPLPSLFIVERDETNSTVVKPVTPSSAAQVIEQLGVKPSFSFESDAIVFVSDQAQANALEVWARKFPFHVTTQFLPAEGAATLHYFANARIALSKFVHTLVFAVFGPGHDPARDEMIDNLKLPPDHILVLESPLAATEATPEPVRLFFEKIEAVCKPHWRI